MFDISAAASGSPINRHNDRYMKGQREDATPEPPGPLAQTSNTTVSRGHATCRQTFRVAPRL